MDGIRPEDPDIERAQLELFMLRDDLHDVADCQIELQSAYCLGIELKGDMAAMRGPTVINIVDDL